MARGGLRLKKGDRVTFRDGRSGEVYSTYSWIDGRTIVSIRGQDPGDKHFLDEVVTVNGVDPNASKKPEAASLKKWAEGAPTEVAHRYTTHGVLAGAYAGRGGKGGKYLGLGNETLRTHAFIDGAKTSPCGIAFNSCSDLDEGTVPSCGRCAARVRALAAKAKKG